MARGIMHGSRAVAEAAKLCDVDVIAAYPITPQTHIVEDLAEFVANGELDCEYVKVESEHSAMSACIGASATGARTFTATSSQGLALMNEVLFIASGMRLPIVMAVANRALSAPINIWNDQQDSISARDAGWVQLYVETNQEALDTVIQAYKIAEDKGVLLPVMVCMDGFVLTHTVEPVDVPDKSIIDAFLPSYKPLLYLDPKDPMAQGAFADPSSYTELRHAQGEAIEKALPVIKRVDREYEKAAGRGYGILEKYNMDGADIVLVAMGSVVGTMREAIDELKGELKVGLLKLKCYRPFPKEELLEALKDAKVVGVLEKDVSIGFGGGGLFADLKATLYASKLRPKVLGFVAGLGGRDVTLDNIKEAARLCRKALKGEAEEVTWLGYQGD